MEKGINYEKHDREYGERIAAILKNSSLVQIDHSVKGVIIESLVGVCASAYCDGAIDAVMGMR